LPWSGIPVRLPERILFLELGNPAGQAHRKEISQGGQEVQERRNQSKSIELIFSVFLQFLLSSLRNLFLGLRTCRPVVERVAQAALTSMSRGRRPKMTVMTNSAKGAIVLSLTLLRARERGCRVRHVVAWMGAGDGCPGDRNRYGGNPGGQFPERTQPCAGGQARN
jgi:hypothetical protein